MRRPYCGMSRKLISLNRIILVGFFLSAVTCLPAMTKPGRPDVEDFAIHFEKEPPTASVPQAISDVNAVIIRRICSQIYKGDFAAARKLLEQNNQLNNPYFGHLDVVVSEYEAIVKKREAARQAAYAEKLAELEKLKVSDNTDVTDVNDVNDINGLQKVFSAIL